MVYVANSSLLLAYRIIISLYASFRIYSQEFIANCSINIFCVYIHTNMEQIQSTGKGVSRVLCKSIQ